MAPIVALIVGKILDYLADHASELIQMIKDLFPDLSGDNEIQAAIQELGYAPTEENLVKLSAALEAKGQDTSRLASLLVNESESPVSAVVKV